jgi:wobble nucleotide-excising tRNase
MISKINVSGAATFHGAHLLDGLKEFNYFFGANGTGKTTISRVINSPVDYPSCSVTWENLVPLETRVYNRDFVALNFSQPLKGVFTLGETTKKTLEDIDMAKEQIKRLQDDINTLNATLQGADGNGGIKTELARRTQKYKEVFFKMKRKHSDKLSGANSGEGMRGCIGSQEIFMKKVMDESTINTALLLTQAELEEKADSIFSNTLTTVSLLPVINAEEIVRHENNPILQKRIIGKDDVDIAAIILKLNNSDWVRQGLPFYEANDGVCPFCQQKTGDDFHKSLAEYFDETFVQDSNTIKTLIDNYFADAYRLQSQIQALIDLQSAFIDIEKLKTEKQLLDSIISLNKQQLIEKQKEASRVVALDSLVSVLANIDGLITAANIKITENNRVVSNLRSEKALLTAQIWKFVVSELSAEIAEYKQMKSNLESAIINISAQIKTKNTEKTQKESELRELEKQTTTIKQTRDDINVLLGAFGFKNFKLELGDELNTYKLIREDGSDAKDTLSEGERNFLTFLYFYHLLKGSQTDTGIANEKIVVIDDPISSLDNDVLFIISTLIRELIQNVRDNNSSIKQIFILTHNIYFHKEVTFNKRRGNGTLAEETFWLVKKNDKASLLEKQISNPIKTSYELLWNEVRKDARNNLTIQNTLRRILENYFKLLGGIPLDELYKRFEGEDKLKCKALCSWVNDGSHSSFDEDFYTPLDTVMIEKFLNVFKQIFQETGHIAHYNMMMGINFETDEVVDSDYVEDGS